MEGAPSTSPMEVAPHSPSGDKKESTKSDKKKSKETAVSLGKTIIEARPVQDPPKPVTPSIFARSKELKPQKLAEETPREMLREEILEHINTREAAAQAELSNLNPNTINAAEAASDAAFLEHARESIDSSDPLSALETPIGEAYTQTVHKLNEVIAHNVPGKNSENNEKVSPEDAPQLVTETGGSGNGGGGRGNKQKPPDQPSDEDEPSESLHEPSQPITQGSGSYPGRPSYSGYETVPDSPAPVSEGVPEKVVLSREERARYEGERKGIFVGGVVGYLYGHHRGRIKTEKRFKPVKAKYERAIDQLKQAVGRNEQDIRKLTGSKLEQVNATKYGKVTEALLTPALATMRRAAEKPNIMPSPKAPLTERRGRNNQEQAAGTYESRASSAAETGQNPSRRRYEQDGIKPAIMAEQMTSRDLKTVAEKIIIDHVSVKEMYEAQRFDEKSLRRIINEYLTGGDVHRAVANEVIKHDAGFELDPRARQARQTAVSGGGAPNNLQPMDWPADYHNDRRHQSDSSKSNSSASAPPTKNQPKNKQNVWVAGATLAVILAVILAIIVLG